MQRIRRMRVIMGLLIWCGALIALAGWWTAAPHGIDRQRLPAELWRYATGARSRYAWRAEQPMPVGVGDPIFLIEPDGAIRQVGEVTSLPERGTAEGPAGEASGELLFYAAAPTLPRDARLTFHEAPRSMQWVLRTMLPPEKQRRISEELSRSFEQHHEEIISALRPIVEDALRDALPVIEQQLAVSLKRHEPDIERLGARYRQEIVEKELIPLVKQEVWPIVYRNAEPTAKEIGREIWEKASLWRFGWRYAYDVSPLPEQRLLEKEWNRYLRDDVTPVVESHMDDIVRVQQRILSDLARNDKVQATLREALGKMLEDRDAQRLVAQIAQEVMVDNPQLHAVLREHWQSERAQRAFRLAAGRLEPTVVRIGEMLLGTPQDGITPEFARVLRNRVLRKDRRWLVLHMPADSADSGDSAAAGVPSEAGLQAEAPAGDGTPVLTVARGSDDGVYPFVGIRGRGPWIEDAP